LLKDVPFPTIVLALFGILLLLVSISPSDVCIENFSRSGSVVQVDLRSDAWRAPVDVLFKKPWSFSLEFGFMIRLHR
jgi:hypothetical protein